MQRIASTITPYMPGTREVFMSPKLSHLSVDVYRETGEAYLYDGCAIVDTRSNVADMSIGDAQDWCVEYERSLWAAAHEEALAEDGERAGLFEVPETTATPVSLVRKYARHTNRPCPPLVGRNRTIRDKAAMIYRMCPPRPPVLRTPELDAAYQQYISDGLADTDGYFAPLNFDTWARTR